MPEEIVVLLPHGVSVTQTSDSDTLSLGGDPIRMWGMVCSFLRALAKQTWGDPLPYDFKVVFPHVLGLVISGLGQAEAVELKEAIRQAFSDSSQQAAA